MNNKLKIIAELSKVRITVMVMLTTVAGYVLAGGYNAGMALPVAGLFILACGSAILNQYQERKEDAVMPRTAKRPIPSGRIKAGSALILALAFSVTGSLIILIGANVQAMLLGITALIWYNVIYTPLKKKTPFAVIPGSVIGAIPPLVGWVAGGGSLLNMQALVLGLFFFVWQVPHFWLLMIKYGPQYEKAGFPSLSRYYSARHIRMVTFIWTLATAVAAMLLPLYGVIKSPYAVAGIILSSVWLIATFLRMLNFSKKLINPMPYFMKINIFAMLMIIVLCVDNLL